MAELTESHRIVTSRSGQPGFLTPLEQWYRKQQNDKADHRDQDMEILDAHACDPWSKWEEDDDGTNISDKDNPNYRIANDL